MKNATGQCVNVTAAGSERHVAATLNMVFSATYKLNLLI
jgi:hypothetical protein